MGADPLAAVVITPRHAELLPLRCVRLGDGPLKDAQERDLAYLLALDVDRLLAPYLIQAGLPAVAAPYGNWEGEGLGGHIGGHYLSACALLVASTSDERVKARLEYALQELQRCYDHRDDGFLGGVPDGAALGEELAAGRLEADLFELNGRWVPLYNLHKILSGLLDVHVHLGDVRALDLAIGLAEWWSGVSQHLDDASFERMLHTEPGGMGEAFALLAALTGDTHHLYEARRFLHRALLGPLLEGRDALDGLHANTQIPKVVGYEMIGQLTGDRALLGAAEVFWSHVVTRRTAAFGGNSVREHFHAEDDFTAALLDPQGPEACNTVNMMELSALMYLRTGRADLVDYMERALLNHVLASQHPDHGGLVYFTPLRPAHYRVYSQPATSMWCCVGSGMEVHARHGAHLAVRGRSGHLSADPTLDLLLHAAARIDDEQGGLRLVVEREGLGAGLVDVTIEALGDVRPSTRTVRLRRPSWSPEASWQLLPGGALAAALLDTSDPEWFTVHLDAAWGPGSAPVRIRLELPAEVLAEPLPDGSAWAAWTHGPVVLASRQGREGTTGLLASDERMGHVAPGPLLPLEHTPVMSPTGRVRLCADGTATATVSVPRHGPNGNDAVEGEAEVRLEPLAGIHDERYTVYWPIGDPRVWRAHLRALDEASTPAGVVDEVTAGQQQAESDHRLEGVESAAGRDGLVHWRSATGWFSYGLTDPQAEARHLIVRQRQGTGLGDELLVDGTPVAHIARAEAPAGCLDLTYDLPPSREGGGTRTVTVRAAPGRRTRDVVLIRLTR